MVRIEGWPVYFFVLGGGAGGGGDAFRGGGGFSDSVFGRLETTRRMRFPLPLVIMPHFSFLTGGGGGGAGGRLSAEVTSFAASGFSEAVT